MKRDITTYPFKGTIGWFRGDNSYLSNFYECEFVYNGIRYCNSEAAFQAQKDLTRSEEFSDLTAKQAKRLGRKVNLRPDWEDVKITLMYEILSEKFKQNPELAEKLKSTKEYLLVEGNTWNDTFWGVCNGVGQNYLGVTLMFVREDLLDTEG